MSYLVCSNTCDKWNMASRDYWSRQFPLIIFQESKMLFVAGVVDTAIYGLYRIKVCAAVKGMVFKQFTLG